MGLFGLENLRIQMRDPYNAGIIVPTSFIMPVKSLGTAGTLDNKYLYSVPNNAGFLYNAYIVGWHIPAL